MALEKLNEALALAEQIGGSGLIIVTLYLTFNTYFEKGDIENATRIFKQMEKDYDKVMKRTMGRPLPTNRVTKLEASVYAIALLLIGFIMIFINH